MSTVSSPFDPSKTPGGSSIPSLLGTGYGKVVFFNLSPFELRLHFDNGDERLAPAWWARRFDVLDDPSDTIAWTIEATPSSSNPPLSQCWIEVYAPDEKIPEQYPAALVRQANVGNQVGVTSSQAVQNDGNPAGTIVVEGTPSGAATSELKMTNDGAAVLGGGNLVITNAGVFSAIPAGAIPLTGLASGALPSGVTITAAQVGTGYPAVDLAAGALPAGVTIAASQVGIGYPGADVSGFVNGAYDVYSTDNNHHIGIGWNSVSKIVEIGPGSTTSDKPLAIALLYVDASGVSQFGIIANGDGSGGVGGTGANKVTWDNLGNLTALSFVGPLTGNAATATTANNLATSAASTTYTASDHQGFPKASDGDVIRPSSTFTGTGPGTYNYGSPTGWAAANTVQICSNEPNSTQTVGVDTLGSTSVHVNMPNNWPFYGFAAKS